MTVYEEPPAGGSRAAEAAATSAGRAHPVAGLPSAHPTTPYWLHALSPLLRGHRTTPALPAAVDVVVIGSGITGSFAADALLEDVAPGRDGGGGGGGPAQHKVLLLEAREACSGATGRNGGHCQPMLYTSAPDVATFELATFHFLARLVAEHGIACDWRALPGGGVHAYLDAEVFAAAAALVDALRAVRPDLAAQVTTVRPDADADADGLTLEALRLRGAVGALVQRHAASLWPYKLVAWVLERLVRTHGASGAFNLQTGTPAQRIRRDGPLWTVETPRGPVRARCVLLATNGYASHLLPAGLADLVVPVRAQIAALVPPGGGTRVATTETVVPAAPGAPRVASLSSSSSSSSSAASSFAASANGGVSSTSRVTVTKTAHGRTTTTTTTMTTTSAPAPRLACSYIFVGHDYGLPGRGRNRDEYLVQRPFLPTGGSGGGGAQTSRSAAASSCSAGTAASATASASSSSPSSPASAAGGLYIWGGGRQRAAGEGVGEWHDDVVEPSVSAYLKANLATVLDVGGDSGDGADPPPPLDAACEWTGVLGFSRDHHPWVGRVPTEYVAATTDDDDEDDDDSSRGTPSGLYVSVGYTGHGMPATPLCGRAVAGMIKRDLGWANSTSTEDGQAVTVSLPVAGGGERAALPRCFLMTPERIQAAQTTCEPVAASDARGILAELQQCLAELRAGN